MNRGLRGSGSVEEDARTLPPTPAGDVGPTPLQASPVRAGSILGTPLSLSPEQHQGVPAEARSE